MRFDDLRRELALIEEALGSLEPAADTSSLVERKDVAKLQLDSVVYPVLTLPGEITSEIFLKCGEADGLAGKPSARRGPLLLLRICRAWTSIALATPALWTDMSIGCYGGRNNVTVDTLGQGIDRWFGRAFALPISLHFWGESSEWYKYVKTLIDRQASLLGTLSLTDDFDASALGEAIHLPILQSLTLETTLSNALIPTFRDTPQLREVSFPMGLHLGPQNVALPWHQLTRFNGDYLPIVDCLQVLRDCPLLSKCSLGAIREAEHSPAPVVHRTLEELSIQDGSAEIIHFLDLPALRALTVKRVTIWGALFNDFLRRSSGSLRTLTYAGKASNDVSLEWFRIANRLVEVTLKRVEVDFIHTLLLELDRSAHPKFLPDLRHLELASSGYLTIDAPVIAALQSRRPIREPNLEAESNAPTAESSSSDRVITRTHEPDPKATTLESLGLIRLCYNYDFDWEEIGKIDWDALYIMGMEGMDMYVGSDKENFLWEW
ncbi:hypothetical protein B0H16DRAFT_1888093 [Mycena metata]|uniref:F-box domain-containing protein n=1 Tax=Mycena metata TaxID=1033252 RepID=A0AAD7N7B1_9AGAR|nr:hypothetical protein B0H16DRAFT_1888093 [Mycena metata]